MIRKNNSDMRLQADKKSKKDSARPQAGHKEAEVMMLVIAICY